MKTTKVTLALSLAGLLSSAVPAFAFRTQQNSNATLNGNRTQTQQRFRGMDRNGDGVITRNEWRGNDNSFRKHDRNGDGILSADELRGNGKNKINKNNRERDDDQFEQEGQRGKHGKSGKQHHDNDDND